MFTDRMRSSAARRLWGAQLLYGERTIRKAIQLCGARPLCGVQILRRHRQLCGERRLYGAQPLCGVPARPSLTNSTKFLLHVFGPDTKYARFSRKSSRAVLRLEWV